MTSEIITFLKKEYPKLSDTNIKLLVGQAKFESGSYTSRFFKEGNNLYGILYVGQKQASGYLLRESDKFKFAKYTSWQNSVRDRMRLYYIKYPHLVGSDDAEKILNTWLYDYLGRNASVKAKNDYKTGVLKLSPTLSDQKKNNTPSSSNVLAIILLTSLWITLN